MRLNPYDRKVTKEIWDNLYSNGDWVNGVHAAPKSPPSNGHRESEMIQPASQEVAILRTMEYNREIGLHRNGRSYIKQLNLSNMVE